MVREFTRVEGYSLKKDKSLRKALILTEKPSVASDFAKALSAKRKDGYYESTDYFIVWSFGHLVDIDDSELPEKWHLEDLPILVKKFKYKPISRDHEKQLNVIKKLLKDTEYVIIATDQGREGELIARLILHYLGWKGKTFRFWTSLALSKEVIKEGLRNLYPINEFDSLFWSALARQHADFAVGINFTRYATLKMRKDSNYGKNDVSQSSKVLFESKSKRPFLNSLVNSKNSVNSVNLVNSVWSVGRVQTPTLALVVERDREIENFKKVKYYEVVSVFESKSGFKYSGRLQKRDLVKTKPAKQEVEKEVKTEELKKETEEVFGFTKEEALKIVNELKDIKKGLVTSIEESRRAEKPPGLFTLASLQKEASAKFGFSAEKTHAIAQKLYQDYKVISYPRTDCPFLPGALVEKVKKLLTQLGYSDVAERVNLKEHKDIFNDVKLTDHHGIIPLGPLPSEVLPDSQEGRIYDLIVKRFVAAFMPPYRYKIYTVKTKLDNYFFTSRFRMVEDPGWRAVYLKAKEEESKGGREEEFEFDLKEQVLPLIEREEVEKLKIFPKEKETKPPKRYTDGTLIAKMKQLGLGTSATRDGIIEILVKRGYLTREKGALISTGKGRMLISFLEKIKCNQLITPELTSQWENFLEKIYTERLNKQGYLEFLNEVYSFVFSFLR